MKHIKSYKEILNESINSRVRSKIVKLLKTQGIQHKVDYEYSAGHFLVPTIEAAEDIADAIGDKFHVTILDRKGKEGNTLVMITEDVNEAIDYMEMDYNSRKEILKKTFPDLMEDSVKDYALKTFKELPPEMQKEIAEQYNVILKDQ